ncbi:hypothetical protein NQ315_000105 [Exocentrus adspersus]|uniref:Reverse transcriptase domain-containing protein n=1 Tax=Exocentrus adspersus TaxID=1586481 RepID=A0AAV8VU87_9CUCU|nr:hypothetical protein NQ315_000105 [Exocentrus adspersus]
MGATVLLEKRVREDQIDGFRDLLLVNVYDEPPGAGYPSRFREVSAWLFGRTERIVLAGDFNGKNEVWGSYETDTRGQDIQEWAILGGFVINNEPQDPPSFCSNRGVGWPDLVINKNVRVTDRVTEEEEESLSDHRHITYSIEIGRAKRAAEVRIRNDLRNANWQNLGTKLRELWASENSSEHSRSIEGVAGSLQRTVVKACQSELRRRRRTAGEMKDWWTVDLERERRKVRAARRRFQEALEEEEERDTLRRLFVDVRNGYKRKIKEAKIKQMEDELATMGNGRRNSLGRLVEEEERVPTNVRKDDATFTNTQEEAYDVLRGLYFPTDNAENDTERHAGMRRRYQQIPENREPHEITRRELEGVVAEMPKGKPPGLDGVPHECLVSVVGEVGEESWKELCVRCMNERSFPKVWKEAEVVWLPKGGGGVRPISLLPTLGKVLDRLVTARVVHSIESTGGFHDQQYGFRYGRNCTMAIGQLVRVVRANRRDGFHSLVVLLDLKNAFGSAWGPAIIEGMRVKGVNGDLIGLVKSFLSGRTASTEGRVWETDVGCPQGSSLGPVLWLVLMESWFEHLEGLRARGVWFQAYADDQAHVLSGRSARRLEQLWEEVWGEENGEQPKSFENIYERVVCPWSLCRKLGERASDSRVQRRKRPYLRAMTKAYKTAPRSDLAGWFVGGAGGGSYNGRENGV